MDLFIKAVILSIRQRYVSHEYPTKAIQKALRQARNRTSTDNDSNKPFDHVLNTSSY